MQQLNYRTFHMTKDEFFYSFGQQTENEKQRVFFESGRGGNYSIAAWHPIATAKSIEQCLHITWQNGEVEISSVELTVSDEYKEIFKEFKTYFESEMKEIGDDEMKQEVEILDLLINK